MMDSRAFSESTRIFHNYAGVHTAFATWLNAMDIDDRDKVDYMDILNKYLKERVIPKSLQGLEVAREGKRDELLTTDEFFKKLMIALDDLTPRELVCNVGFPDKGLSFCLNFLNKVFETPNIYNLFNNCIDKPIKERIFVLKDSSDTDWFKRRAYGTSSRKEAITIPFKEVTTEMVELIEKKLQELAPNEQFQLGNYTDTLNKHFDDTNGQQKKRNEQSESPEWQALLQAAKGLHKEDLKHVTLIALQLKSGEKSSDFDSGLTPSPRKQARMLQTPKPKSCSRKLFVPDKEAMLNETDSE